MFEHRQMTPALYDGFVVGSNAMLGLAALTLLIAVALWQVEVDPMCWTVAGVV